MKRYRVKHYEYFNEKGELKYEYYYVQEYKRFWITGWFRWKDITHKECWSLGCDKTRTNFASLNDATEFINSVLCKEKPYDEGRRTVVAEFNCSNK